MSKRVETDCNKEDWWTEVKMGGWCQRGSGKNEDSELDWDGCEWRRMEDNFLAGQTSQRVVAPREEEEEEEEEEEVYYFNNET